jgi:hypothetical protein
MAVLLLILVIFVPCKKVLDFFPRICYTDLGYDSLLKDSRELRYFCFMDEPPLYEKKTEPPQVCSTEERLCVPVITEVISRHRVRNIDG